MTARVRIILGRGPSLRNASKGWIGMGALLFVAWAQ